MASRRPGAPAAVSNQKTQTMSVLEDEITCDILREVRCDLADAIEDIGNALGLLRNACSDVDDCNNVKGAQMSANVAAELLAGLEMKFSQMAATVDKWAEPALPLSATKRSKP